MTIPYEDRSDDVLRCPGCNAKVGIEIPDPTDDTDENVMRVAVLHPQPLCKWLTKENATDWVQYMVDMVIDTPQPS